MNKNNEIPWYPWQPNQKYAEWAHKTKFPNGHIHFFLLVSFKLSAIWNQNE